MPASSRGRGAPRLRAAALLLAAAPLLLSSAIGQDSIATLLEVRPDTATATIRFICSASFVFQQAQDSDPSRVVVDLRGVRNGLKEKVNFKSELVQEISVATHSAEGVEGTRVILQLRRPMPVLLQQEKDALAVILGGREGPLPVKPASPPAPTAPPVAGKATVAGTGVTVPGIRSDYIIGKEDLLEIGVFQQPDLTRTVRVSGDGTISLPLLGVVPLEGLTTTQAEGALRDLLSDRYLNDPQVWVFVKEAKSKKISVVGAVEKPGTLEMLGSRTLLEAISEAGGLTHQAGKELHVLRTDPSGATTRIDIDLDDLMIHGNPELNIPLQPGDVLNVPIDRILHVYVDGAVRKPGEVEYKASRPLTLLQAIAAAGGLSERASQKGIVVIRTGDTGAQSTTKVDLKAVRKGKQDNFVLQNGDSIYVPETFF
ncbi:MAG TPA: polysaccharide biosynthesis/export family protein [Candidatus Polarisedimenticolia bacterium]|nr:polysaccharide biosynthesis/export family protein [Candidatus Polarisedimenticolia bacterium]